MKIVIAPDAFKESLSAREVAECIRAGFRAVFPGATYQLLPMADGGEGTVQAVLDALGGSWRAATVSGPLGDPVEARYGLTAEHLAIIEMAEASGLTRIAPERRNPLLTSSYGTGELIRAALDAGATRFMLGIGGSATNDGGAGMLQALGVRLLDGQDRPLPHGGAALSQLARIDASAIDARIQGCRFDIACDVDNPLTGPRGASAVFGPQKGASPEMVQQLDRNLARFAECIRRDIGIEVEQAPGSGAAGGMGAAFLAFCNGQLRSGCDMVAEAIGLDDALRDADLVITGEGCIDHQTIQGKTPIGVARIAQRHGCPVIAIAGSLTAGSKAIRQHGIHAAVAAVSRSCSLAQALEEAEENIRRAACNAAALLEVGMRLKR